MECAIKMARKYQSASGHPERYRIITFEGAFHGRTLATIAAGGQPKYLEGFGPKVDGFDQVPFGDLEALKAAIGPETAAILIEPIQGEGGIRPVPPQCLRGLRALCDEHGLLLMLRRGADRRRPHRAGSSPMKSPASRPTSWPSAKGIGGGFPLGACLATEEAAKGMTVGTHGTTYGGNPLAMAVGNAVLDVVLAPGFLDHVRAHGPAPAPAARRTAGPPPARDRLRARRGPDASGQAARQQWAISPRRRAAEHLLVIPAGDNVVRLLPPLDHRRGRGDAKRVKRLEAACARMEARSTRPTEPRREQGDNAKQPRHFLDLSEVMRDRAAPHSRRRRAIEGRARQGRRSPALRPLDGKMLAMIFDKPSTRTARLLRCRHARTRRRDDHADRRGNAARPRRDHRRHRARPVALCRCDHDPHPRTTTICNELANYATVPVINGLTKLSHPCQVMADVMTFEEHRGPIKRPHGRLDRRREQCADELGPGGAALRLHDQCRDAARTRAGAALSSTGQAPQASSST